MRITNNCTVNITFSPYNKNEYPIDNEYNVGIKTLKNSKHKLVMDIPVKLVTLYICIICGILINELDIIIIILITFITQ